MSTATDFSLVFQESFTASVVDTTILPSLIVRSANTADFNKMNCAYYNSFTESMTELKFRDFFGTDATRKPYLDAIAAKLHADVAGVNLLAAYNDIKCFTNTVDKKEKITYTVDLTKFNTTLNDAGIASTEWSTGGKFQLLFNFVVGSGAGAQLFTVGVDWLMQN